MYSCLPVTLFLIRFHSLYKENILYISDIFFSRIPTFLSLHYFLRFGRNFLKETNNVIGTQLNISACLGEATNMFTK